MSSQDTDKITPPEKQDSNEIVIEAFLLKFLVDFVHRRYKNKGIRPANKEINNIKAIKINFKAIRFIVLQ
jgi:uncharacterized protein (DUF2164 family)